MIGGDDLGAPKARNPHEAGAAAPTGEEVDEPKRRPIALVQIFRDEQEGPTLRWTIEEFTHFAEHPFGARAYELAAQRVAFFGRADPG
jgi:hypothetical protein